MLKKGMQKKIKVILLVLLLAVGLFACGKKEQMKNHVSVDHVEDLLYALSHWKPQSTLDKLIKRIEEEDAALGKAWRDISDFWNYANYEMTIHTDTVPEGLPKDDSVAIVVFGHVLNDDGTMQDELIGRLELGLALAKAYPNAYIVTTGGPTAKNNRNVSEGGLMGDWYLEHGVDSERIIVEEHAKDTVGNAENTYKILKEQYPQVDSWIIVSSDHHVPRASILAYTKCRLAAAKTGEESMKIISNMGYVSDYDGYESTGLTEKCVNELNILFMMEEDE